MRRVWLAATAAGLLILSACGGGDDIESIAQDACDDMIAAYEDDDPEAMMAANENAMDRARDISDDDMEATMELMEAFEDACSELEDMLMGG